MVFFTQTPVLAITLGALSVGAYYDPPKTTYPKNYDGTAKRTANDGKVYTSLFPGNNYCWTGAKGVYKCQSLNKNGRCLPSAVNMHNCKIKVPDCPSPDMPKISCAATDGTKHPFDNSTPFFCWYKMGIKWECTTEGIRETCSNGMLDSKKCPINKPNCPNENMLETTCVHKGALYTFGSPEDNLCWYKNGEGYGCEPKEVDGSCSRGSIEILDCSIKKIHCPPANKPSTTCINSLGAITVFENTTAFPYSQCRRNEVDVSSCPIDFPITPCPSVYTNDVCAASDGKTLWLPQMKIPGAPVCCSAIKPYHCIQPRISACPTGFFNIGTCKIKKPKYGYNDN